MITVAIAVTVIAMPKRTYATACRSSPGGAALEAAIKSEFMRVRLVGLAGLAISLEPWALGHESLVVSSESSAMSHEA